MNGKKFGWLMFILTLGLGGISGAIYVCLAEEMLWGTPVWGRVLVVGLFFVIPLCLSALGAFIAQAIRRRNFNVRSYGYRWLSIVLAVVAAGVLGCGSQYLYMQDFTVNTQKVETKKAVDIVLLFDCSQSMGSSMNNCMETSKEVAKDLVDSVDADCRMQLIAFSDRVLQNTQLFNMDAVGKADAKAIIDTFAVSGTTNFNLPLREAYATLTDSTLSAASQGKTVIMLTDAENSVDSSVRDLYVAAQIPVYTITITPQQDSDQVSRLADFANATGGFNTPVALGASLEDFSLDLENAFQQAYQSALSSVPNAFTIVSFGMEDFNVIRAIIRLLTLAIYALICQLVFFRRLDKAALISIPAMTLLSFGVICLTGLGSYLVGLIGSTAAFVLIFWTVYALYCKVLPRNDYVSKRH